MEGVACVRPWVVAPPAGQFLLVLVVVLEEGGFSRLMCSSFERAADQLAADQFTKVRSLEDDDEHEDQCTSDIGAHRATKPISRAKPLAS
jgi:hypothetical protein